jgi:hypothetical protein
MWRFKGIMRYYFRFQSFYTKTIFKETYMCQTKHENSNTGILESDSQADNNPGILESDYHRLEA